MRAGGTVTISMKRTSLLGLSSVRLYQVHALLARPHHRCQSAAEAVRGRSTRSGVALHRTEPRRATDMSLWTQRTVRREAGRVAYTNGGAASHRTNGQREATALDRRSSAWLPPNGNIAPH